MGRRLVTRAARWPLKEPFTISRGTVDFVDTVIAEITDGPHRGRGECRPYPRYGETVASVETAIAAIAPAVERGAGRAELQSLLAAGAARNAVDAALWDLEAKTRGTSAAELAGIAAPQPLTTAYTISLDTPERMQAAARRAKDRPILKVKLGADGDCDRIAAVRAAAPGALLMVDANEGWTDGLLAANVDACRKAGVALIEQPLPAGQDAVLAGAPRPVPVCADESVHDRHGLESLVGRYDAINVKLDKTGGLTEALELIAAAQALGLRIMVGCMVASSLAMAPAIIAAQHAEFVDLDGPLLLAADDPNPLRYEASLVYPPSASLWG